MPYSKQIREECRKAMQRSTETLNGIAGRDAALECGCTAQWELAFDENDRIGSASFRTNGCGYMAAGGEVITAQIEGKRLGELSGLEREELEAGASHKIGATSDRRHCIAACVEALHKAFDEQRKRVSSTFHGESPLVCTCFGISEDRIMAMIEEYDPYSAEELMSVSNAGKGCGSCRPLIQELIDAVRYTKL